MTNLTSANVDLGYVDKRKALSAGGENQTYTHGAVIFTGNAAGSTTTMVGANATLTAGSNVVRVGDKFRLVDNNNNAKENTIFKVTNVQADTPGAGSTTVTFAPPAKAATANTDRIRMLSTVNFMDEESLDTRIKSLDNSYTDDLPLMTQNDKVYALRLLQDPGGI